MKVVLAFDKFKGSATATQLNAAARDALNDIEGLTVVTVPVADGGDGTTSVLAAAMQGTWITAPAMPPLLNLPPVQASYFLCNDSTTLIEVAAASGLTLIPADARDIMRANSLGTGLLIRDAIEHGAQHIILGLGGSATCDAAMGIMCALGAEFLDANGHYLFPCGESLGKISHIETAGIPQAIKDCRFTLLTDVDNPLHGPQGAARIYGPQKGASPEQVELLDTGLAHIADMVGNDIACKPGCGAAGGIPALMMHLLECELLPGGPYVLSMGGMSQALDGTDLVITGEGRLDKQTLMGKGPGCVFAMARNRGIPVAAVCGMVDPDFDSIDAGLYAVVAVSEGLPEDLAMDTDATVARVAQAVKKLITAFLNA